MMILMKRKSAGKSAGKSITPDLLKGRIMLRVQEYATLTGTPIATVYKYLNTGELPSIRIGSTLRIPVSAVSAQMKGVDYAVLKGNGSDN